MPYFPEQICANAVSAAKRALVGLSDAKDNAGKAQKWFFLCSSGGHQNKRGRPYRLGGDALTGQSRPGSLHDQQSVPLQLLLLGNMRMFFNI